ncbi:MAG: ATP synthase F0 subunit B [Acidobacteria bacterium]|nr:ATP synthase F0 subunit B [Acidobacteriota bacterium]
MSFSKRWIHTLIWLTVLAPTQVLAAGGIESVFSDTWLTIGKAFNLVVIIGILVYFLRKPIGHFFARRSADIQRRIREAEQARDAAQARLADIQARLEKLDTEMDEIRRQAEADARVEREKILTQTEKDVVKMRQRARNEIESLKMQTIRELREYTAAKVVEMAGDVLRRELTTEDEERLFNSFLEKMGDKH